MRTWKGIAWNLQCLAPDDDFYAGVAPILAEVLPQTFFWDEVTHLLDRAHVEYTDARFEALVASKSRSWSLTAGTGKDPPVDFVCHRIANALSLTLAVRDDAWRGHGAALAGELEGLTVQFLDALRDKLLFRGDSGVRLNFYPQLDYPHVDPEPSHPMFRFDLVVDILDPRLAKDLERIDQPQLGADMRRVCAARTPRSVRRVAAGEQTILFWTDALHDEDALTKAATEHERWLDKAIAGST